MKKNLSVILFCALLVVFIGCRPRGILSSNEMREVLVDLHKTDAMLQMAGIGMMDKEQMQIYYAQVLQRHGITQAQFDSSLVWYTDHPQIFNKIYPKVLARCEKEESMWTELEHQQAAKGALPLRELRPITDIEQEMLHGLSFDLIPGAEADTTELLLPVQSVSSDKLPATGENVESSQPTVSDRDMKAVDSQPAEVSSEPATLHVLQPVDSAIMRAKRKREQMLNANQRF